MGALKGKWGDDFMFAIDGDIYSIPIPTNLSCAEEQGTCRRTGHLPSCLRNVLVIQHIMPLHATKSEQQASPSFSWSLGFKRKICLFYSFAEMFYFLNSTCRQQLKTTKQMCSLSRNKHKTAFPKTLAHATRWRSPEHWDNNRWISLMIAAVTFRCDGNDESDT